MATGHQLWTWPPLGTGAALSCPVVPGVWAVWGSWWHEERRIGASPARVTLIRERAAQSADHLAEKRQKWAVVGEVVCDLGESRNEANTTTHNSDFPAQHNRQVTTPATRCVHPSAYRTCRVAGVHPSCALVSSSCRLGPAGVHYVRVHWADHLNHVAEAQSHCAHSAHHAPPSP